MTTMEMVITRAGELMLQGEALGAAALAGEPSPGLLAAIEDECAFLHELGAAVVRDAEMDAIEHRCERLERMLAGAGGILSRDPAS